MNLWDVLILAAVAAAVFFAVRSMRKKRSRGDCCGGSCCGGCDGCAGKPSGVKDNW